MTTRLELHSETVLTQDGWRLPLKRFTSRACADPTPILCLHGHATNGWSWHGSADGGMVGALCAAGREVWTVDLRGAAATVAPRRGAPVRIADKIACDVPAAIHAVLAHGGPRGQIDLVGHSLGGVMIYLLGLSAHPLAARVRRAVTIGSPLGAPGARVPAALRGPTAGRLVGLLGRLPVCGIAASFGRRAPMSAFPNHFAPQHTAPADFDGFMRRGVSDVYGAELAELAAWLRSDDARVLSPSLTTAGPPPRLPFPTRFIVGADDGLTTPASVAEAYHLLGDRRSDLFVLPGYRHADILIGRAARAEVSPLLVAWLAAPRRTRPAATAPRRARACVA